MYEQLPQKTATSAGDMAAKFEARVAEMLKATTALSDAAFDLHWRCVVKGWLLRGEVSII